MSGRVYREVICPYCGHRYMTYYYEEDKEMISLTINDEVKYGAHDLCPMCSKWLYYTFDNINGITEEDVKETKYHWKRIR